MKKNKFVLFIIFTVSCIGCYSSLLMKEYVFASICFIPLIGSLIITVRNHSFASHFERIEYEEEQVRLKKFLDRNDQDHQESVKSVPVRYAAIKRVKRAMLLERLFKKRYERRILLKKFLYFIYIFLTLLVSQLFLSVVMDGHTLEDIGEGIIVLSPFCLLSALAIVKIMTKEDKY